MCVCVCVVCMLGGEGVRTGRRVDLSKESRGKARSCNVCQSGRGAPVIFNSPAGGWWLVQHDNRASVSMTMLMIFLPFLLGIGRDRGRKAGGNILCSTRLPWSQKPFNVPQPTLSTEHFTSHDES